MATGLDQAIQNITKAFEQYGLWNDTVLIFTSDNGAECGIGSGNNYPLRGMARYIKKLMFFFFVENCIKYDTRSFFLSKFQGL